MKRIKTWMRENGIDAITTASIGGSATWGMRWPEELRGVPPKALLATFRKVDVQGWEIPVVKVVEVMGQTIIRIPMHGWGNPPQIDDSIGVFLLLKELGVKQVIVDASVGGLSVNPWDIVIAHDFIADPLAKLAAARFGEEAGVGTWSRMVQPFCPELRKILIEAADGQKAKQDINLDPNKLGRLHQKGVYVGTWGPFETAAEIRQMREDETHTVVGQSTPQEAMMARLCGMCFGGIYIAANWAERGKRGVWVDGGMAEFYRKCAVPMGEIVWLALEKLAVDGKPPCQCAEIPKSTDLGEFPVDR